MFRIPAEDQYISAVGRAVYNFAYLEWVIVGVADKLKPGFIGGVSNLTAGQIADQAIHIVTARPSADAVVQERLVAVTNRFKELTVRRNQLVHGNPITATGGEQCLYYSGRSGTTTWAVSDILDLAKQFEDAAIEANDLFYNSLS